MLYSRSGSLRIGKSLIGRIRPSSLKFDVLPGSWSKPSRGLKTRRFMGGRQTNCLSRAGTVGGALTVTFRCW
jgi:hypothetical protein